MVAQRLNRNFHIHKMWIFGSGSGCGLKIHFHIQHPKKFGYESLLWLREPIKKRKLRRSRFRDVSETSILGLLLKF